MTCATSSSRRRPQAEQASTTRSRRGGDFAALAKKYSTDPGSAANGGKLTIVRGQTVAPFDTTAFLLTTNTVSRPVKTEFGYHVIQPISAVKPATTTPLKDAKAQIKAQLLDKAKTDLITKWTADTKDFFAKKVAYATGFAPPAAATAVGDDHRLIRRGAPRARRSSSCRS